MQLKPHIEALRLEVHQPPYSASFADMHVRLSAFNRILMSGAERGNLDDWPENTTNSRKREF